MENRNNYANVNVPPERIRCDTGSEVDGCCADNDNKHGQIRAGIMVAVEELSLTGHAAPALQGESERKRESV